MKFTQTGTGTWASDMKAYDAVALNGKREPIGTLAPRFVITLKENGTYKVAEQHIGRKIIIGKCKTLEKAIKMAETSI